MFQHWTLNPSQFQLHRSEAEWKPKLQWGKVLSNLEELWRKRIFQFYLFFVTIAHHQVRSLARVAFCTKPRLPWIGCAKGARQGVYKLFNTGQNFKTGPHWDPWPTMECLAHNGVFGPQWGPWATDFIRFKNHVKTWAEPWVTIICNALGSQSTVKKCMAWVWGA